MTLRTSFFSAQLWKRGGMGLSLAVLVSALASPVLASPAKARDRALKALAEVEVAAGQLKPLLTATTRTYRLGALIAEADLHLRTGQYDIAIDKLNLVLELHAQGKTSLGTDADAHYMLGEAYFQSGELYSARRHFIVVVERAEDPVYAGLGGPSVSRLVDITLRIQRKDELPDVLAKVDKMLARSSSDSLRYARAKALFAIGRFADAVGESENVGGASLYGQRAAYLRGTALMKQAQQAVEQSPEGKPDYRQAIAAFEQAVVPGSAEAQKEAGASEVTDLSWLAVARLHYESQNYERAAGSYQKIQRNSPNFAEALFELAWTNVRLGKFALAQRALEALSVLNPGLLDGADGELLRADLMLREGKFAAAQQAYEEVRAKFDPLKNQVQAYLENHQDAAIYYDKLTAAEIEVSQELPELAIDWAREAAEEERVFAIVDDVARSRDLIKRSRRIATLLRASLGSTSRAKVFPEVLHQLESVVSLLNQLGVARLALAHGMDDVASTGGKELQSVRDQRRKLMGRLGEVPTNPGDFTVRQSQSENSWNSVSQLLQRLQLQADHLRALVNGLRRLLSESDRYGIKADAASLERFRLEIDENEKDLAVYTRRIDELREQVEVGRVQSGFGDERFLEDEKVRLGFRELFGKEVQLAAKSSDSSEAAYSVSVAPILSRMVTTEGRLDGVVKQLDSALVTKSEEVKRSLNAEAAAIEVFASRLDTMDQHARLLVGEVAKQNFVRAKDRLKDVVLRADVGLVQQAWEVREEQKQRVFDLLRERAQEDRMINDELREVLDDAEELP